MTKKFRETPMTMNRYKAVVESPPKYEVHRVDDSVVTISHYQLKKEKKEVVYPNVSMRNYRLKV